MGAIAVFTETGNTAHLISNFRPQAEVYAFAHLPPVCNRMNLLWGVRPVRRPHALTGYQMLASTEQELLRKGVIKTGDVRGVVAGTQMACGSTNFMRLHEVPQNGTSTDSAERLAARGKARGEHIRAIRCRIVRSRNNVDDGQCMGLRAPGNGTPPRSGGIR
jgi:Pyruvate kinase, alpha/beta domain